MPIVDFHNHYYPPRYLETLQAGQTSVRVTVDSEGNRWFGCADWDFNTSEYVGGVTQHGSAPVLGGVARAHSGPNGGKFESFAPRLFLDAGERFLEIPLDVVVEGFQGGDIEDPDAGGAVSRQALLDKVVDGPEEGCKGFSRSGGGQDQRVLTCGDAGPAEQLRGAGGAVGGGKPPAHRRVEIVQDRLRGHGRPYERTG